jgi:hypothetical protein
MATLSAKMTPEEIQRAINQVMGIAEIDTLQVLMPGPDAVEVKARRAADGEWFQGVVQRREWIGER